MNRETDEKIDSLRDRYRLVERERQVDDSVVEWIDDRIHRQVFGQTD